MTQYIDKDALVAEIEKLKLCTMDEHMNFYSEAAEGEYRALSNLESFLDTLEVKEVEEEPISNDLEEASRNYTDNEEYGDDVYYAIKAAFKAGAEWQKEQMIIKGLRVS